jgi:hypothetical protein
MMASVSTNIDPPFSATLSHATSLRVFLFLFRHISINFCDATLVLLTKEHLQSEIKLSNYLSLFGWVSSVNAGTHSDSFQERAFIFMTIYLFVV